MLTFLIKDLITEALEMLDGQNAFYDAISAVNSSYSSLEENVIAIGSGQNGSGYAAQLHAGAASLSSRINHIPPRRFYSALEGVHKSVHDLQDQLPKRSTYLDSLLAEIDHFADEYDEYLSKPNATNATSLILVSAEIKRCLEDFRGALDLFDSLLDDLPAEDQVDGSLSIVLPYTVEVTDFIAKLTAIQSIYSELCQLLDISETDSPLEIGKIESGSLWAKVLGSSVALTLVTQFIQSSAGYLYHNYTVEGQISSVPGKVESLDKVVDLRQKLKAAGIKTKDIDEQLAKSAHTIAKDLNTLLENQPSIILNGHQIPVTESGSIGKIQERRIPRLPHNNKPTQ
jgi:hypothetical protein